MFASSLSQFATHEQAIRDHMKAVRTREEALDALKHRRKNVASKADTAERKLSKMAPEHKNTPAQTELLTRLREEIRELDSDIMTEEAGLGDFKRATTKMMMTLKFGGLQECCEKGIVRALYLHSQVFTYASQIIADAGKLIITEIPQDTTEPGSSRPFYSGHAHTESYVSEAQRNLSEVTFDASVSPARPRVSHSNEYNTTTDSHGSSSVMPMRDEASVASADHSSLSPPNPQFGNYAYKVN